MLKLKLDYFENLYYKKMNPNYKHYKKYYQLFLEIQFDLEDPENLEVLLHLEFLVNLENQLYLAFPVNLENQ